MTIIKASYGFIKCCERAQDLFFHFTEVIGVKPPSPSAKT